MERRTCGRKERARCAWEGWLSAGWGRCALLLVHVPLLQLEFRGALDLGFRTSRADRLPFLTLVTYTKKNWHLLAWFFKILFKLKKGGGGSKVSFAGKKSIFLIPRCSQQQFFDSPVGSCLAGMLSFCGTRLRVRKIPNSGSFLLSQSTGCLCRCCKDILLIIFVFVLEIFAVAHLGVPEEGFTARLRNVWSTQLEERVPRQE